MIRWRSRPLIFLPASMPWLVSATLPEVFTLCASTRAPEDFTVRSFARPVPGVAAQTAVHGEGDPACKHDPAADRQHPQAAADAAPAGKRLQDRLAVRGDTRSSAGKTPVTRPSTAMTKIPPGWTVSSPKRQPLNFSIIGPNRTMRPNPTRRRPHRHRRAPRRTRAPRHGTNLATGAAARADQPQLPAQAAPPTERRSGRDDRPREDVRGQVVGSPTTAYFWPRATIRELVAVFWEHRIVNGTLCVLLAALTVVVGRWAGRQGGSPSRRDPNDRPVSAPGATGDRPRLPQSPRRPGT